MASEQGPSGSLAASTMERPNPTVTVNLTDLEGLISAVVRRELAAHQRTTDTSPTDGGEPIVVAIGRSAIPSHGIHFVHRF